MTAIRAILDFPGRPRTLYTDPVRVVACSSVADVRAALREVERGSCDGLAAVGFVAYEAAPAFDPALAVRAPRGPLPLLWFALFDRYHEVASTRTEGHLPLEWRADTERDTFDRAVRTIRDDIAAGDFYQVNFTLRFLADAVIEPIALYEALSDSRHGRYHAFIETPEWAVISTSPELFFECRGDVVTTRPMKGTARRGRWLDEDRAAAAQLAASPKDRAENLMIVDLLRNDIGRIAQFGSVHVPSMFDIETYPTVHQMTSTVRAQRRENIRLDDIFTALFPCGSVTGAPKVTAMRSITQLEQSPRGVYCGAIGIVENGAATFNVAIRTITVDKVARTACYGAGAGITWDSNAAAEYDEIIAKAALLNEHVPAFQLIETLRLQNGVYPRLQLHLERLRDSAEYWQFAPRTAEHAAAALARERLAARDGTWRVRLTADRDGNIDITRTRLDSTIDDTPRAVAIAHSPVDSRDRLLFHKTTARAVYQHHRDQHPHAFDVLLFNEMGCVTEFTTGNVVVQHAGEMLTPARTCGLLAGTFRQQLMQQRRIRETLLTIDDVLCAERLWFINSVREWVPVVLAAQSVEHAARRAG